MPQEDVGPRAELEARVHELEQEFARRMLERGFDPAQAENVALPGSLAKLYAELEELRSNLDTPET